VQLCLAAAWPQCVMAGAECLVVDNNSTDGTADIVASFREAAGQPPALRLLSAPQQGLSHARNTGLAAAQAPVVLFLDDDAIPSAGWLAACLAAFHVHDGAGRQLVACGGPIHPIFEGARPNWLVPAYHGLYSILDLGADDRLFPLGQYPFGANMAFNLTVTGPLHFDTDLGRVGTSLLSGEEAKIFQAIARQGGQVGYVAAMAVHHHIPVSRLHPEWLQERFYYAGVSERRTCNSRCAWLRLAGMAILRVLVRQGQAFLPVMTGRPQVRLRAVCARRFLAGLMVRGKS
jgi:glucosyl-dolichyl phosphate glucuronosyltransferase